jgi:hypothetical protein
MPTYADVFRVELMRRHNDVTSQVCLPLSLSVSLSLSLSRARALSLSWR